MARCWTFNAHYYRTAATCTEQPNSSPLSHPNISEHPQHGAAIADSGGNGSRHNSFTLFRLKFNLLTVDQAWPSLAVRTAQTKRKAEDHNVQRVTKAIKHYELAPGDGKIRSDDLGVQSPAPPKPPPLPQTIRVTPTTRSKFFKDIPVHDGKPEGTNFGLRSDFYLVLESQEGKELGRVETIAKSPEERNLLNAVCVVIRRSSKGACWVNSSLVLDHNFLEQRSVLYFDILWQNAASFAEAILTDFYRSPEKDLTDLLIPKSSTPTNGGWEPRNFYESVYTPPHDSKSVEAIEVPGLRTGLYAFQGRTLRWLLQREGSREVLDGQTQSVPSSTNNGFVPLDDIDGRRCLFNPWLALCTTEDSPLLRATDRLKGGILAEEMGLGKTVEILSLIQMHKRPQSDILLQDGIQRTGATLIIAPRAIIEQWKEEIDTHAPSLEVMTYAGMKSHGSKGQFTSQELIAILHAQDIVLVTYETLSKEIWFATDPPERGRRYKRIHERPKSPLVQIDWWRVVLDEAQMVESGVTNAAQVAVQLRRQNAWAVTGTPLRKDSHDLLGLLTFLRLEPYCLSGPLWNRLLTNHIPIFRAMINAICLRHSKDQVRGELQLPPQKRVVIRIPFTAVEEQNYGQMFEEMVADCGTDLDGVPRPDPEDENDSKTIGHMRGWLARLRQICLHPEVGDRNRRALGRGDRAPLRTVSDVLKVMCEQNETSLRTEERVRLQSMLRRGQIAEHAKWPKQAMSIWEQVEREASENVITDRRALKEIESSEKMVHPKEEIDDEEEDSLASRISRFKHRLRISLELKHTATFFIANAIYQIKTDESLTLPDSEAFKTLEEQEIAKYEEAKQLRRELLTGVTAQTKALVSSIMTRIERNDFVHIPMIKDPPVSGGLETRKYIEHLEDLVDTLNKQTELLIAWRQRLAQAVCAPLVDQEETELTGEEYENSTKQEDQIHAYVEAMRLIIADRSQALTGQKNTNVRRDAANLLRSAITGEGHAPALMKQLLAECNSIRIGETREGDIEICLRGLINQLNQHHGSLGFGSKGVAKQAEKDILERILDHVKPEASKQQKTIAALEKELDMFSDIVNARVEYYKQLQDISDLVAPYEEEMTAEERRARLDRMRDSEAQSQSRVDKLKARAKYLEHLQSDSMTENVERKCIICQDLFDTGCLTSCGHVYCKDCILLWWKQHRNCPTCKAALSRSSMYPITYKPLTASVHEQSQSTTPAPGSPHAAVNDSTATIYSGINQHILNEIKLIDLKGSYSSKIDMLARHLLWIREHDPGAKSIVFSQFRDFLGILEHAFTRFGIGWSSIESGPAGIEKFKKEAGIECLLLHAKAQASGLNLVNATHVFICEPLINPAIELQVIARVHRIGQHSATTVWMYLVEDTVEKAIYEISAERRMAHINSAPHRQGGRKAKRLANGTTRDNNLEDDLDAANSLEMEEASAAKLLVNGRSGGEQVSKEDVWPCLFKYRPAIHNAIMTDEAERVATSFLAGEAAASRRNAA